MLMAPGHAGCPRPRWSPCGCGSRQKARSRRWTRQVVADHEHVEMLVQRVDRERPRRVGGRRQHIGQGRHLHDVGRMPPPAPSVWKLWMVRLEGGERCFDKAASFSVSVWMATCVASGRPPRGSCRWRRRRAPVFVQLEADGAAIDLLAQASGPRWRCPCRGKPRFIGKASPPTAWRMPCARPRRAGGGKGAGGRPGAAADHGGDAVISASSICCGQMKWMWCRYRRA